MFQMKTRTPSGGVVLFGLVLLGLSASIPAALLMQEPEARADLPAYLEIDVSGEPARLPGYEPRGTR
jgi:hypothetical protein